MPRSTNLERAERFLKVRLSRADKRDVRTVACIMEEWASRRLGETDSQVTKAIDLLGPNCEDPVQAIRFAKQRVVEAYNQVCEGEETPEPETYFYRRQLLVDAAKALGMKLKTH